MGYRNQQAAIQRELDKFIELLEVILPRYSGLLKIDDPTAEELRELGELEHFLIEMNGRIAEIKQMLEHDVFGHSLDVYYKLKEKAKSGEPGSEAKLNRLRESFNESLHGGTFINWN